jgi:hypothetical protein
MYHQCAVCNAVLDMGCIIPGDSTGRGPAKFCLSDQRSEGVARIVAEPLEDRRCLRVGARGVSPPPPLSSEAEERGIKTGTALTPGCAPLSLTRGYNQVTPNGVSVCVPQVSLRMVDMMLADGKITPMRLRGKLVRFYFPDVLQESREKAKTSKRNVARRV